MAAMLPKMTDLGKRVIFPGHDKRQKYGVLRFVGETEFSEGVWCGVELDQPTGKNNGSIHGIRYFTCEANFGVFVPITKLELDCGRSSRSRPNSQPSSRDASVERKEPQSRPSTAKSSTTRGSIPSLSVNKIGLGMQHELVNRLAQPLRRSSHPANANNNRRQPMKAFATKGIEARAKEDKKPLLPFRSGGIYKAASTENIRGLKDNERTKSGAQKLSQGMPAKKSSSERDLRNAGKDAGSVVKSTEPLGSKAKWKQVRTKSSSDILADPTPASSKSSTPSSSSHTSSSSHASSSGPTSSSSSSHTSLEGYPWPRTSTPGNRDDLTPDGCSSPEESEESLTQHVENTTPNNGFLDTFLDTPGSQARLPMATAEVPPTVPPTTASAPLVACDTTDSQGLASHVTRFTAQVTSPSISHHSIQAPENGHAHKYYNNQPAGTATLDHPLTSKLITDGARLLNQLLGQNKSLVGVSAEEVAGFFQQQTKKWETLVVGLECKLEQEQLKSQQQQEELSRLKQLEAKTIQKQGLNGSTLSETRTVKPRPTATATATAIILSPPEMKSSH